MNKDQVKGRVDKAKGTVKEIAGKAVGNKDLEAKGKVQKTYGNARALTGDAPELPPPIGSVESEP